MVYCHQSNQSWRIFRNNFHIGPYQTVLGAEMSKQLQFILDQITLYSCCYDRGLLGFISSRYFLILLYQKRNVFAFNMILVLWLKQQHKDRHPCRVFSTSLLWLSRHMKRPKWSCGEQVWYLNTWFSSLRSWVQYYLWQHVGFSDGLYLYDLSFRKVHETQV